MTKYQAEIRQSKPTGNIPTCEWNNNNKRIEWRYYVKLEIDKPQPEEIFALASRRLPISVSSPIPINKDIRDIITNGKIGETL